MLKKLPLVKMIPCLFSVFLLPAMEPITNNYKKILTPKTAAAQQLYAQVLGSIKNKDDLNKAISHNNTPLLITAATSDEHFATSRLLLFHGANPDIVSDTGNTPLRQAAFHCASKTVALLLYWKADPNHNQYQLNNTKETPLHLACRTYLDSFAQEINKAHIEMVEWLCAAGADTNARDCHGRTPLFSATLGFQNNTLSIFLQPTLKQRFHITRKSIIETLMFCKSNPQLLDAQGHSALTQPDGEPYLTIFTAHKLNERRKKLRAVLLKFLRGNMQKPERISPFKNMPSDIIRYILKQTYP